MGNAICSSCSHPREPGNIYLEKKKLNHLDELIPKVSKIQNSYRNHQAYSVLKDKEKSCQQLFETKITQYGSFVSETEMQASINPIIIEIDKQLTETTNLPKNIYTHTFSILPIKFKDGNIYSGNWNYNGKKEGFGINIRPDGSLYKGYWENDHITRYGTYIDVQGNYYQGELKNGVACGSGVLYMKEKFKYTGNFDNDVQNGIGKEENYEDNTIYEGEYKDGIKEGVGKLAFPDGSYYEGEFKGGEMNGKGTLKFPDNREYKGEFKDGKMDGKGVFKWENGNMYKGDYLNGQKHGYGTFYWDADQYYEGHWFNNKQHGEGLYYLNGKTLKGQFRYGKIIMKK